MHESAPCAFHICHKFHLVHEILQLLSGRQTHALGSLGSGEYRWCHQESLHLDSAGHRESGECVKEDRDVQLFHQVDWVVKSNHELKQSIHTQDLFNHQ